MTPFGLPGWTMVAGLFVVGACLGRWINVLCERISRRERLLDQWRVCVDRVARADVLRAGWPILGPLGSAGRSVFGAGRGWRAAAVELFNGLLLATLYAFEVPLVDGADVLASSVSVREPFGPQPGPSSGWTSPVLFLHVRFLFHAVLVQALLAATVVDMELKIIPSLTTDPFIVLGLVSSFVLGWLHLLPVWFQDDSMLKLFLGHDSPFVGWGPVPVWLLEHPHWHGLACSVAGVVVGGGVVWFVRAAGGWSLGQEAMGQGDVYMVMMIGAFLGWQGALVVFFLAPVCAIAVVAVQWMTVTEREIPYGPYLSLATVLVLLGWRWIFPAIDQIFALGPLLALFGGAMGLMLVVVLRLVRGVKQLLGIDGEWDDEPAAEWTAADQNQYLAGENVDDRRGRWRTERWPGVSASRGRTQHDRWRHGD